MEKRRRSSQEIKQETVQITRQAEGNLTQGARDLVITAGVLGHWCREAQQRGRPFRGLACPMIKNWRV